MRPLRFVSLAGSLVLLSFVTRPAAAQVRIGASIGREFDESDHWVVFGGEAAIPIQRSHFIIQPRFTYHPLEGGSAYQVDANLLYDFEVVPSSIVRPYVGAGAGYNHTSFDSGLGTSFSESKVVANIVAGIRFRLKGNAALSPFVNTEYSFAKQFTNLYQMAIGLSYTLPKK